MGRKKQQESEFYFFMVEKKPEVEKRLGRLVSMADLPQHLYAEWKALPDLKKEKYKVMKQQSRETAEKLDCRGLSMSELKRQEEKRKKKIEDMRREILNTVDVYASGSILHEATFYIISTSYYVRTEEDFYSPAELGLVQFSFRRGIIKEYTVILKPVIPLSYGYSAKVHSETTHNLLEESNCGVEDKIEVSQELKEFIVKENNKLPPLYTLEEEIEQTEAILDDISGKGYYRIYSLDQLFMHLYSRTFPEHPIPQSIAKDMLTHCGLDYHPSIACEWHTMYQKDAGKYCSLSCARRWVFMMCDNMNLNDTFGVVPQEGKHLPCAASVCGVLVDVPRTNIMGPFEKTSVNSWCPIPEDEDLGFTGAYSGKEENGAPVESPWNRKASTRSSSSASLAALLSSQFPDASSDQEFPSLAARKTYKAAVEPSSFTTLAGIGRGMRPDDIPYLGVPGMGRGKKYRQPKKE